MDCAVKSSKGSWWRGLALVFCAWASLVPACAIAQAPPPPQEAVVAVSEGTAVQASCDCTYQRIGPKVDIALVVLITLALVAVLLAMSREWGTTSQRWTCRSSALLMIIGGTALLWWAGSIIYLGYNPWQDEAAVGEVHWLDTLLGTSPKWVAALVLWGLARPLWRQAERMPRWRIG